MHSYDVPFSFLDYTLTKHLSQTETTKNTQNKWTLSSFGQEQTLNFQLDFDILINNLKLCKYRKE